MTEVTLVIENSAKCGEGRQWLDPEHVGTGPRTHELEIIAKDGRRVPLELSTRLISRQGKPIGVQGIARDITERKQAEAALQESEERYRTLITATPKFDDAGQFTGAFGIFRDITDRRQAEEKLKYLSTHDALTGLYNRAFFEEEMARLERGRRFPVSIVMADVDDLKVTNDRDGHAAGDELLRRAAQALSAAFRAEDIVARIGGDEFVVLLPNTDAAAAGTALVRVRAILHDHNAAHRGTPLRLSLGTSTADKGDMLVASLKRADANMYQEKHGK